MKQLILLMMIVTTSVLPVFSQNENVVERTVVDIQNEVVEEQAVFPGGEDALYKWVYSNLKYPKKAKKNRVEGDVAIKFTVEKNGTVSEVEILKGTDPLLDEEALRIVKMMPKWQAAKQNGAIVRGQYVMIIQFRSSKKDRNQRIMLENYYEYMKKNKE